MKWDLVQAEAIKKLYSGDTSVRYFIESDAAGMIQFMGRYIVYRMPVFYCYVAFPPMTEFKHNLIMNAWNRADQTLLVQRRVELYQRKPVQIFVNAETDDEIKVNTSFYNKYVEKADQLTFWGSDYRSPVFAINGETPDVENIVFMVLPIV